MGKLIDITRILDESSDDFMNKLKKVADSLDNADISDEILVKIRDYIIVELKIMLGMSTLDEDIIQTIKPIFFDGIQDVYDQSNDHCYFCSPMADPNDEAYGDFRRACPVCTMKLESFMKAAGIPDSKARFARAHRRTSVEKIGRC